MTEGSISAGQASGSTAVTAYLRQHGPDGILRVGAIATVNNNEASFQFDQPYRIPEKNCVGATAIGAAANNAVSSYFNIILIKNPD
jgi:glycine cleavage system protein P-like pyridoxal-binding family